MGMGGLARRRVLKGMAYGVAGMLATPWMGACGEPVTRQAASPRRPIGVATVPASPAPPRPATASAATPVAGPTTVVAAATTPSPPHRCAWQRYDTTPRPADPWRGGAAAEGAATSFAEKTKAANLIVLVTARELLSAHWDTEDGQRPANPHLGGFRIVTPIRARVKRVVKGRYTLPDIYLAVVGGTVGQDCYSVSNSLYFGDGGASGADYLYFTSPDEYPKTPPVPGDRRYRYFGGYSAYPISPGGTITIGPERDIMGNKKDDPPRTITLDEAVREIAAILGTPTPTPTR